MIKRVIFLVLCCASFISCSGLDIETSRSYPDNPDYSRNSKAGKYFKSDLLIYKTNQ